MAYPRLASTISLAFGSILEMSGVARVPRRKFKRVANAILTIAGIIFASRASRQGLKRGWDRSAPNGRRNSRVTDLAIGEVIIKYSGTLERYAGDGVGVRQ
jgi:hypothetical protein